MKAFINLGISISALFGILLTGCGPTARQSATQTSEAAAILAASWTATPSNTSIPTNTPLPTNTIIPTDQPTATKPPYVINPTLTPGLFGGPNGSVYALGNKMYVVFGRFEAIPEMDNQALIGNFYIEGDPSGTPVNVFFADQFSIGRYTGSFAGDSVWTGGTFEEFRQLIVVGDLVEMRYPMGFNPDFDKVLGELAIGNWAARTPSNLLLNPAMIGIVLK